MIIRFDDLKYILFLYKLAKSYGSWHIKCKFSNCTDPIVSYFIVINNDKENYEQKNSSLGAVKLIFEFLSFDLKENKKRKNRRENILLGKR